MIKKYYITLTLISLFTGVLCFTGCKPKNKRQSNEQFLSSDPGRVVPLTPGRFKKGIPPDSITGKYIRLLNLACREVLTDWWNNSPCKDNEGQYIDFGYLENNTKKGDYGQETRGGIRPPSQNAYVTAVALYTGVYDKDFTRVDNKLAADRIRTIVKSLAKDHLANGGTGVPWGDMWQSAQWAGKTAIAGLLIWDQLAPQDREYVRKMIEYEANRFLDKTAPVANENYIKNTRAEEDGWDADGMQAACALMPNHPNYRKWYNKAIEYRITALATREDLKNETIIDGKPVKEWITGFNIDSLGALGNHSVYPHPDYMAAPVRHAIEGALFLSLAGQPVPEANRFNCNLIYRNFVHHKWNGYCIYQPDGTIYWPIEKESDSRFSYDTYSMIDAGAGFLNYDNMVSIKGAEWEELHHQKALDSGTTGYHIAGSFLVHWLEYNGIKP